MLQSACAYTFAVFLGFPTKLSHPAYGPYGLCRHDSFLLLLLLFEFGIHIFNMAAEEMYFWKYVKLKMYLSREPNKIFTCGKKIL